jgi:hypothetical protein
MRAIFLIGGVLAISADATAAMGITLTQDQTVNGAPGTPQVMSFSPDKLRVTSQENEIIFRGDLNKAWLVRPADKTYIELIPESVSQKSHREDQAAAQIQQRLASMPPAQRNQVEARIASQGNTPDGGNLAPMVSYQMAGEPKKIGDWTCTPVQATLNGLSLQEFCLAKLSDLGLASNDLKPLVDFVAFMGTTGEQSALDIDGIKKQLGFEGFPIQSSFKSPDGSRTVETILKSIEHEDPLAGTFDIPAGYTRRER